MDEYEAIKRLKQGHIDGLETLVQLYQTKALKAAWAICHSQAQAEDIVQNSFLQAYERINQFDVTRPFSPWFLKIVVNNALMSARNKRLVSLEAFDLNQSEVFANIEPTIYETMEAAETKEVIWAALDQLSPGQRAVIVMRYYLDLSDSEISELLKCPPGTTRRRMYDARKRLTQLLPTWIRPS